VSPARARFDATKSGGSGPGETSYLSGADSTSCCNCTVDQAERDDADETEGFEPVG